MKNSFKKKTNPLPLFLPHVKWRKKKTLTCTPPLPFKSKINFKKKIKVHPLPLNNE
jgi:hypothetical protein